MTWFWGISAKADRDRLDKREIHRNILVLRVLSSRLRGRSDALDLSREYDGLTTESISNLGFSGIEHLRCVGAVGAFLREAHQPQMGLSTARPVAVRALQTLAKLVPLIVVRSWDFRRRSASPMRCPGIIDQASDDDLIARSCQLRPRRGASLCLQNVGKGFQLTFDLCRRRT